MSKRSLCLTSLVGAIPGAGLAYVMVMAFVNYAGGSSNAFKALAGTLLLIGGTLAVMPLGILLFSGPKSEKKIKKKKIEGYEGFASNAAASTTIFFASLQGAQSSP